MESKSTKKKAVLLVVAGALVALLAVAGTLMLFTAQTEKATNVVTIGGLDVVLQESGTDGDGKAVPWTDVDGTFTGIDYGKGVLPGAELDKKPRIFNKEDSASVYAFLKLDLQVLDASGSPINFAAGWDKYFGSPAERDAFFYAFIASLDTDPHWYGLSTSPQWRDNETTLSGGYFYTNAATDDTLLALAPGEHTTNLFEKVTIPSSIGGGKYSDAWAGATIKVTLTGYAVQSENNPYDPTTTPNANFNAGQQEAFEELKGAINLW